MALKRFLALFFRVKSSHPDATTIAFKLGDTALSCQDAQFDTETNAWTITFTATS